MAKLMLASNLKASEKFEDNLVEGAICLDILQDENVMKESYEYNGKRYLNIKVVKRKKVTEHGSTHYIEIKESYKKGG